MKKIIYFLSILTILSCGTQKQGVSKKEEKQIITKVNFPKDNPNIIVLNDKHAFNYIKSGNYFEILNLNNEKLIIGNIYKEDEKWKSNIEFKTVNKSFSNSKIISRNELIFSLAESNVITENFELDSEKLLAYIEKYNGK
ncbi:hypothetical protein LV84_04316 [Algoriphagus ratkowskyi]|uniref:Uncharacterized protein n=1 Tax=Algoriphagus ratkowskyi TaxID=57028 RepID=A0A2W7SDS7_9BACT|nr:hypothetical protein [Algoriphagus ratkowskyi]PZX48802.1 hypothetical protein LV84_04316 [Algoriphagus ratkowskyi]TXD75344.1 hypothetical protein ESW18_20840 [Algoriphagus ratkowskyi]